MYQHWLCSVEESTLGGTFLLCIKHFWLENPSEGQIWFMSGEHSDFAPNNQKKSNVNQDPLIFTQDRELDF